MAGTLEQLAIAAKSAPPRERFIHTAALRDYVCTRTEAMIVDEIARITNTTIGGVLVGAGLSARAQDALVRRMRELNGA